MNVTNHAAKTQLSRLIEAAQNGEDVVIAKGSTPVARLVPIHPEKFRFGVLSELSGTEPDFLEPLDEAELEAWEGS